MNLNLWIALPEVDHNGMNGPDDQLSDIALRFKRGQLDPSTVQNLYKTRVAGPNTWHLWSIILDAEDHNDVVSQINSFRAEYPGAQVVGLWKPDGAMYGCEVVWNEVPNPEYVGEPRYIANPDYQPDRSIFETYDPREEIENPAWVPQFILVKSQTGTPQYDGVDPTPYMPDGVVADVNLPLGWSERVFA